MNALSRRWLRAALQLCAAALLFPLGFHAATALGGWPCMHALTSVRWDGVSLGVSVFMEVCWLGTRILTPALVLASLPFLGAAWWSARARFPFRPPTL